MALDLSVPREFRSLLRLGTCSWKDDTWKGLIYEQGKTYRPDAKKRVLTYLNLNNHFEGSAPLSIGRLLDVLAGKKIDDEPF